MQRFQTKSSLDDVTHAEALDKTGFWGTRGAGCLILCRSTGRFLLGKRSKEVDEPLTWGGFGGAIDSTENPSEAALREVQEETGLPESATPALVPLFVFRCGTFEFHNYLAVVESEFAPVLDWETTRAGWYEWQRFPGPAHFGLTAVLQDAASVSTIKRFLP